MFTVNHDEAMDFGLVEEGEYEVQLIGAEEDASPGGAIFINLQYVIRNDVDQKHKNQRLFDRIWQTKKTGKYHPGFINTIAKALQIPNGKQYSTLEELLSDWKGRPVKVRVKHNEYEGETYANIDSYMPTKLMQVNHQWKGENPLLQDQIAGFDSVEDDNIPF